MGTEVACRIGVALTRGVAVMVGLCGVAAAALYGMILADIAKRAESWPAVALWTLIAAEVAAAVGFLAGAVRSSGNRALVLYSFLGLSWAIAFLNVVALAYIRPY
jgi:hypothetical protein